MNDMQIGDFDKEDDISKSVYQDEVNSLKIDKLNNRVTIISIILPCLIGAVIFFAYLDVKEQVVSVDTTKETEVKQLSQDLEEKFNALDVKIAEVGYTLDKKLPEIDKQITNIEGRLAKLDSVKAEKENMENRLAKMQKVISNNSDQYKGLLHTIERINNKTLSIVNEIDDKLKKDIGELEDQMNQKISDIPDYKEQLTGIREQLDGLDQKVAQLEERTPEPSVIENRIGDLEKQLIRKVEKLDVKFDKKILEIKKRLEYETSAGSARDNEVKKRDSDLMEKSPQPIIDEEETGDEEGIQEKSLTQ